jgi:hypothetical protein
MSSLGGGWIRIQGLGSSDDSDEAEDLGDITPFPLEVLGVLIELMHAIFYKF